MRYGSDMEYYADAIALRAWKLVFQHPVTEATIVIELPADFLAQKK
jgi:23S rRNA-/tRNA-specific pseudouridylate synthase